MAETPRGSDGRFQKSDEQTPAPSGAFEFAEDPGVDPFADRPPEAWPAAAPAAPAETREPTGLPMDHLKPPAAAVSATHGQPASPATAEPSSAAAPPSSTPAPDALTALKQEFAEYRAQQTQIMQQMLQQLQGRTSPDSKTPAPAQPQAAPAKKEFNRQALEDKGYDAEMIDMMERTHRMEEWIAQQYQRDQQREQQEAARRQNEFYENLDALFSQRAAVFGGDPMTKLVADSPAAFRRRIVANSIIGQINAGTASPAQIASLIDQQVAMYGFMPLPGATSQSAAPAPANAQQGLWATPVLPPSGREARDVPVGPGKAIRTVTEKLRQYDKLRSAPLTSNGAADSEEDTLY